MKAVALHEGQSCPGGKQMLKASAPSWNLAGPGPCLAQVGAAWEIAPLPPGSHAVFQKCVSFTQTGISSLLKLLLFFSAPPLWLLPFYRLKMLS